MMEYFTRFLQLVEFCITQDKQYIHKDIILKTNGKQNKNTEISHTFKTPDTTKLNDTLVKKNKYIFKLIIP